MTVAREDRFEIVGPLAGHRPNGRVQLARDLAHDGRLVVVKQLADHERSSLGASIATAATAHPNLASVVAASSARIIATFVDGPDLRTTVARLPHAVDDRALAVASLFLGVADGLAALHAARICHGDLRPENVLLAGGLSAKLIDYGQVGPHGGTLAYMAPERIHAERSPSVAADLFALGVMLYEALFSCHPFANDLTADPARVAQAILAGRTRPVADGRCPAELMALVDGLLEHEPAKRMCDARLAVSALADTASRGLLELGRDDDRREMPSTPGPLWPQLFEPLEVALSRLSAALDGDPVIVEVTGPPGSGKTFLLRQLARRTRWRFDVNPSVARSETAARAGRPTLFLLDEVPLDAPEVAPASPAPSVVAVSADSSIPDVIALPAALGGVAVERRLKQLPRRVRATVRTVALCGGVLRNREIAALGLSTADLVRADDAGFLTRDGSGGAALSIGVDSTALSADVTPDETARIAELVLPCLDLARLDDLVRAADLAAAARLAEGASLLDRAASVLEQAGRTRDALERYQKSNRLRSGVAETLRSCVRVARALNEIQVAVDASSELVALGGRRADPRLTAEGLRLRGFAHLANTVEPRRLRLAEGDFDEALALLGDHDLVERARLMLGMATAAKRRGELEDAAVRYKVALGLLTAGDTESLRLVCLQNLGEVSLARRHYDDASSAFAAATEGLERRGERRDCAIALVSLGRAGWLGGKLWLGLEDFRRAYEMLRDSPPKLRLFPLVNIVYSEAHLGLSSPAIHELEKLASSLSATEPLQTAAALVNVAQAHRLAGRLDLAEEIALNAQRLARLASHLGAEVEALAELALIARAARSTAAAKFAREALERCRGLEDEGATSVAAYVATLLGVAGGDVLAAQARATASAEWRPLLGLALGVRLARRQQVEPSREILRQSAGETLDLAAMAGPARSAFLSRSEVRTLVLELVAVARGLEDIELCASLNERNDGDDWLGAVVASARDRLAGRRLSASRLRRALQRVAGTTMEESAAHTIARLANRDRGDQR